MTHVRLRRPSLTAAGGDDILIPPKETWFDGAETRHGEMTFVRSQEMKIDLTPEQADMLSTKEDIKTIIRENPDTVMAFDIFDGIDLIGFALVHRFEERKYFLWEYAIDVRFQNRHKGTRALAELIEYMKARHGAKEITTTYIYGNDHARHVYEKVGFVETDVVDEPDCHEVNMAYYL